MHTIWIILTCTAILVSLTSAGTTWWLWKTDRLVGKYWECCVHGCYLLLCLSIMVLAAILVSEDEQPRPIFETCCSAILFLVVTLSGLRKVIIPERVEIPTAYY
jgi:hypothetical protein